MLNKKAKKALALGALTGLTTTLAQASVNVQQYYPAANSTYTMTEDALLDIAPKDPIWTGSRLFFSANYNWLNDALIQYNESRTQREATLVDGVQTLDLGVGWFLDRRISVNFATTMGLVHLPSQANRFSFGDSRAFIKWRLTGDNAIVAVSLIPEVRMPTGSQELFLSDGSFGFGGLLAIERDFGPVRASANIGYRYSPTAQFMDLDYTQRLPMALGLFVPIGQKWGVVGEAAGSLVLPVNSYNNPSEVYLGARHQFNRDCAILAGMSMGAFTAEAGNDVRLSAGIRFSPMPDPVVAEAPKSIPLPPPAPVIIEKKVVIIKKEPRVVFTPKEIKISEEIKFEHNKAILTPSGKKLLDEVASVMKKNRKGYRKILIEGHTNELGSYPHNQKLSEQRAAAVREYLASRGIKAKDLMTIGYGKSKPKALKLVKGLSKEAKLAANRRVEFKVIN